MAGNQTLCRIVCTGGPCGGKSSALARLRKAAEEKGLSFYAVPEVPTILFSGNCCFPGLDGGNKLVAFETALMHLQIQIEQTFQQIAISSERPSVIVYDRGLIDIAAYLPQEAWQNILAHDKYTEADMMERYDGVMHLVTAADGAEQFYKFGHVKDDSGNSVFRQETPEMARELDQKVHACWAAHPCVARIENLDDGLEGKMKRATDFMFQCIEQGHGRRLASSKARPRPPIERADKPLVHRIVCTGGACGGRSSAFSSLKQLAESNNVDFYCIPRISTILFSGGCKFPGLEGGDKLIEFETALLKLQLQIERSFFQIAKSTGRKSLIVIDRGLLDIANDLPRESWEQILAASHLKEDSLLRRYDGVMHLVTAADGAEQFYLQGHGGTIYRQETPEQARELDRRLWECWAGHPHHARIANLDDGIEGKLRRAANFVSERLALDPLPDDEELPHQVFQISMTFYNKCSTIDGEINRNLFDELLLDLLPEWSNTDTSALLSAADMDERPIKHWLFSIPIQGRLVQSMKKEQTLGIEIERFLRWLYQVDSNNTVDFHNKLAAANSGWTVS